MPKRQFLVCLIAVLGFLHIGTASAVTFQVQTDNAIVNPGEFLSVDIIVADLGLFSAPSLSGYDIDLGFDSSLFSLDSVSFGDPLLGNQLDLLGLTTVSDATESPNSLNLFELSFDDQVTQDALQLDIFTLARVVFEAEAAGTGLFALSINLLTDSLGGDLFADLIIPARVQVVPAPAVIPVPAAVWLFGTGLIGLIGLGKKRSRAA